MKHKIKQSLAPLLFLVLGCMTGAASVEGQTAVGTKTGTGKSVYIEKPPSEWALVREVQGGFEKHDEVFHELMRYVGANYRAAGFCFGIYPTDPDAVKSGTLKWRVGVRITPGKPLGYGNRQPIADRNSRSISQLNSDRARLRAPEKPYQVELVEGTKTAVLESTVEEAAKDGLSMFAWMAENGYVQVGATRMEYMSHEGPPNKIRTRIIIPVKNDSRDCRFRLRFDFN